MKIVLIVLLIAIPFLNAELSFLNLGQQNEQKEHIKESPISYSEAAYHMAEGAAITAVVCLPTMYCFKFMGFEAMCKEELCYANYPFLPMCAALLQSSPGFSWYMKYALKAYNSRQPQAVKKNMISNYALLL